MFTFFLCAMIMIDYLSFIIELDLNPSISLLNYSMTGYTQNLLYSITAV